MTLSELVYDIQNIYSSFSQSDDNSLADRQIVFWINSYRSFLLNQELSKGRTISKAFYQTLPIINLEKIKGEMEECLLRSKEPIPQTIFSNLKDYLSYVGPPDGSKNFDEINFHDLQFIPYSKYSKKYPKYAIKDRYLYIYLPPTLNLNKISVSGVFEEPNKVEELKDPFIGLNFEYPISGKMVPTIREMILNKELRIGTNFKEDKINDGKEES